MKSASYESILVDLIPLRERRDYAVKGLDAVEQNALRFVEKGGHLPMGLELQLRKRWKKYDNEKKVFFPNQPRSSNVHTSNGLELRKTLQDKVSIQADKIMTREAIIKHCPEHLKDDRPDSEQQWCLLDSKGEKLLGRHPTKEKALNQEKAIQIHKHKGASENTINWVVPKLSKEAGEYFENGETQKFLKSKGKVFSNKKELLSFLTKGELVEITKKELSSNNKNLTLSESSFNKELENEDYRKSFEAMEEKLLDKGKITLYAPIVLKIGEMFYGYAGNRRMNLAFKYDIPLKVWLVSI